MLTLGFLLVLGLELVLLGVVKMVMVLGFLVIERLVLVLELLGVVLVFEVLGVVLVLGKGRFQELLVLGLAKGFCWDFGEVACFLRKCSKLLLNVSVCCLNDVFVCGLGIVDAVGEH